MSRLSGDQVDALLGRAAREVDAGLLPSCQVALALDGEVVVDEALGDATVESRYVMFSCTKAIVASAFWLLIQEGLVDPTDRVVDLLPEFMADGEPERRDVITVEHVMLHTSGFPHAPLPPPVWETREARLDRMREWRLNWEPGSRFEYHATSAHWVLAEIIHRLTGIDHRDFVTDRVLAPHGLERLRLGVARAEQGDIRPLANVGDPATPDELEAAIGVRELPMTEVTPDALVGFNEPGTLATGVPGGGAVATAADMARFYQCLLHNPAGVWKDDTLRRFTGEVRNTFPDLFGQPTLRTLGLCTAGDDGKSALRGFGRTTSPSAFGHGGAGGQIAWADPGSGLSFVYFTNGLDENVLRQARRGVALSSLAATCAS